MDIEDPLLSSLLLIVVTLIFSAFFSGMEIAFLSANRLKIEVERKKGFAPSAIVSYFTKKPVQFITTMLIGNNIAIVIYGIATAKVLEPFIEHYISSSPVSIFIIQTAVSTLVILLFAEFLPKALFRNNPNVTLTAFAIPVTFIYGALYPISRIIILLSHGIIRVFFRVKIKKKQEPLSFGKVDLDNFIEDTQKAKQHAKEDERNFKIIANALDFSEVKIRECIVPRTELVAVGLSDSIAKLKQKFFQSGNSKILVYDGSIDKIIGYIHHSQLFNSPKSIKGMVKEAPIVPETMTAQKLLAIFMKKSKSLAVVVDEFGGTAGIVTIEDIMEEIFGEIEDEHDTREGQVDKQISKNEFEFTGRIEIDFINEKYGLGIEVSEEYETVAGLILHRHGSIPRVNETITIGRLRFLILAVSPTRIDRVRLKITEETN